MWTAFTIVIIALLSSYGAAVAITSALSLSIIAFTAILYVDDTDLFVMGKTPSEPIRDVFLRARALIDIWDSALWSTGGSLRPDKCWFYVASFKWKGSGWSYETIEDRLFSIQVLNDEGEMEEDKRIEYNSLEVTLGVHLAVNGSNQGTINHLANETTDWINHIKSSWLYRWETALALVTTLARTWTYPLQATTMNEKECEGIMKPVYKELLSKMGANKHLPRVYRFVPCSLGGIEMPHIFRLQGTAYLESFLFHMKKDTLIGKMMEAQLENCTLEIGVGSNLFGPDYSEFHFLLTDCWMKHTWQFCSQYKIQLSGEFMKPQLQRENDFFLMESLIQEG